MPRSLEREAEAAPAAASPNTSRDERARERRLERLTATEVREWLKGALHRVELGDDLLDFVLRHTEGNPFLVTQLMRALAEENVFSHNGAAWVWTRSGGVWTQQGAKLVGSGAVGDAFQGTSVSLSADGNTAIVGGNVDSIFNGAAWVFTRDNNGLWTQQGNKLVGTLNNGAAEQGISVAISDDGNTAMVGGWQDDHSKGAAWVFTRSGGVWTQQGAKLVMDANDLLDDLQILLPETKPSPEAAVRPLPLLSDEERRVYEAIKATETSIDDIGTACELPSGTVSSVLLRLELKRLVKQLPGKYFVKLG
jgi:hypothetical protein